MKVDFEESDSAVPTGKTSMAQKTKLSQYLLGKDVAALKAATEHPFLAAAANGSLPKEDLKAWLAQDRLYAIAYTNFIGQLLAKVPVPTIPQRRQTLQWRMADLFIDALANIRTEMQLFEDSAGEEGFLDELGVSPSVQTRAYQDLFAGAAAPSKPLIVGLAVLWATEECYLRAWKHAAAQVPANLHASQVDIMQRVFIPNWSSPEFESFVKRIEVLLDELGFRFLSGGSEWAECEVAFAQVLESERNFWPASGKQGRG